MAVPSPLPPVVSPAFQAPIPPVVPPVFPPVVPVLYGLARCTGEGFHSLGGESWHPPPQSGAQGPSPGEEHGEMEPGDRWTGTIRRTLEGLPSRAIRLSALLGALKEEGLALEGRENWLVRWLENQQTLCRIIPDRAGPWARCPGPKTTPDASPGSALPDRDPFILVRPPARQGPGQEGRAIQKIQESLTAWGEELDDGSPPSLARWIRALREAERACQVIRSRREVPE